MVSKTLCFNMYMKQADGGVKGKLVQSSDQEANESGEENGGSSDLDYSSVHLRQSLESKGDSEAVVELDQIAVEEK